jgi:hypothetical protein
MKIISLSGEHKEELSLMMSFCLPGPKVRTDRKGLLK